MEQELNFNVFACDSIWSVTILTNFLIEFLKSTSLQFAEMLKTRRTLHLYRDRLKGEQKMAFNRY